MNERVVISGVGMVTPLGIGKLGIDASNRDRVGIILGVSYGSTDVAAQFASILFTEGPRPILVPNMVINAPAGHTSIELGFIGALTPQSTTVRLRLRQPLPMRLPRLKTVAPMFFWPEARISFQNFSLKS